MDKDSVRFDDSDAADSRAAGSVAAGSGRRAAEWLAADWGLGVASKQGGGSSGAAANEPVSCLNLQIGVNLEIATIRAIPLHV